MLLSALAPVPYEHSRCSVREMTASGFKGTSRATAGGCVEKVTPVRLGRRMRRVCTGSL